MSRPASSRWIALPTSVEPVKATLSIPSCLTRCAPVEPSPVTMLTTPGRQLGLPADVGEEERGERRRLGRLEHDGVAAGQRRRDLPREHQQREVPGDDLRGHAERPRPPVGERVLELVRPAGVVEEVRGRERQVDVARLLIGLPPSSDSATASSRARSCRIRAMRKRYFARSDGRQRRPAVREGVAGRRDREVDVLRARVRDLGQRLLGGGRHGREPLAGAGLDLLAADEEPVALLEADDVARLGRGGVVPLEGGWRSVGSLLDVGHLSRS